MIIKILGTGCSKCKLLQKVTEDAAQKLGCEYKIIKVDKIEDIMQYDIMATPGLVIDEKVVLTGRIPESKEIEDILNHQKLSQDFIKGCGCKNC